MKSKEKIFRGVDFDIGILEVKSREPLKPDLEYADYLHYRILADSIATGESVDVEYFFNKDNRLDLMIAFYNLSDKHAIYPLVEELRRYLEREYGRPRQDELGWYHWKFEDKKSREPGTIEINLLGETEAGYMGVELELAKYYAYEARVK